MKSISHYVRTAREAWEDRHERIEAMRAIARQAPEKWAAADSGQRSSIVVICALCLIAIAVLVF